jgi:hypothetical protein
MGKPGMRSQRNKASTRVKTGPAAIGRALNLKIDEKERNRLAWEATERFIKSGVEIKDIYGKLDR